MEAAKPSPLSEGTDFLIYITGDPHGDPARLSAPGIRLRKQDSLIVCGDFGFIWDGSPKEERILKKLCRKKYQLLFVDGVHENFSLLDKYPVEEYCGGRARHIGGNVWQLLRGEIYRIEEQTVFAFGGGESADDDFRPQDEEVWKKELPSETEMKNGLANLEAAGNRVDLIVSHEAPSSLKGFINMDDNYRNWLHAYLEQINKSCTFRKWYFGRYHMDKVLTHAHTAVYRRILPAGERTEK